MGAKRFISFLLLPRMSAPLLDDAANAADLEVYLRAHAAKVAPWDGRVDDEDEDDVNDDEIDGGEIDGSAVAAASATAGSPILVHSAEVNEARPQASGAGESGQRSAVSVSASATPSASASDVLSSLSELAFDFSLVLPATSGPSSWSSWSEDDKKLFLFAVCLYKKDMRFVARALSRPVEECIDYYYGSFKFSPGSGYAALKTMDRSRPGDVEDSAEEESDGGGDDSDNPRRCERCGVSSDRGMQLFGCDECNLWLCFACTGADSASQLANSDSQFTCGSCLHGKEPPRPTRRAL